MLKVLALRIAVKLEETGLLGILVQEICFGQYCSRASTVKILTVP